MEIPRTRDKHALGPLGKIKFLPIQNAEGSLLFDDLFSLYNSVEEFESSGVDKFGLTGILWQLNRSDSFTIMGRAVVCEGREKEGLT